jgi:hypothetical protein
VGHTVDTVYRYYGGGGIYVRKVKSRGGGPYFQLVRSYRNEEGQPRQEVLVHLGVHETPEAAMSAWPKEVAHLRRIGRDRQADDLQKRGGEHGAGFVSLTRTGQTGVYRLTMRDAGQGPPARVPREKERREAV